MIKKIVTHGGGAHRDELIAIAVSLTKIEGNPAVVRRDPTLDELEDPEVLVVDVGARLEPERNNYDHHQNKDSQAAFWLILKHFLGWDMDVAEAIYPWIKFSSMLDVRGPFQTAKAYGISMDTMTAASMSPLDGALVEMFSTDENGQMVALLRRIGSKIVSGYQATIERLERLRKEAQRVDISPKIYGLCHLIGEKPSLAMDLFRKRNFPEAAFSVVPDDRGAGFTLYRFDDNPALALNKLAGLPGVIFAHKGGFIAKTGTPLPTPAEIQAGTRELREILDIVRKALC